MNKFLRIYHCGEQIHYFNTFQIQFIFNVREFVWKNLYVDV